MKVPNILFVKEECPFCVKAIDLLESRGLTYNLVEFDQDQEEEQEEESDTNPVLDARLLLDQEEDDEDDFVF